MENKANQLYLQLIASGGNFDHKKNKAKKLLGASEGHKSKNRLRTSPKLGGLFRTHTFFGAEDAQLKDTQLSRTNSHNDISFPQDMKAGDTLVGENIAQLKQVKSFYEMNPMTMMPSMMPSSDTQSQNPLSRVASSKHL